jgi:hypothetical protein
MSIDEIRRLPTVSLLDAAAVLGLGRTITYKMVHEDRFPCKVVRFGNAWRVPTPALLEAIGVE